MNIIQQYIKDVISITSEKQLRYYTYLFENMQYFTDKDLYIPQTKKEIKYIDSAIPKRCFDNCIKIAMKDKKFRYFEGFYLGGKIPLPLEHGFLVTEDNKVFDPTAMCIDLEVSLYGGIEIPTNELKLNLGYSNFFPYLMKLGKIPKKVAIF